MQAGDVRLGQVFANDQQNVIPRYQRPYVWDEAKNWEPLWQDIRQAAEEVEAEARTGSYRGDPRTYFLGAVVLQQRRVPPQRVTSWNVVDGQQRLTTLQILIAAARSTAHDLCAQSLSAKFASLIQNQAAIIHQDFPQDRFKVWPLPQDLEMFLWAVREPENRDTPGEPSHRIVMAREWFETAIRDWVQEAEDPIERLEYLHTTVKDRMELVKITLEANDDPQVIFEVLNYRGVPLDAADLIKNLLFHALDADGHDAYADELLMNEWLPLDRAPWRGEVTTGRIRRKLIDLLLAYWLTIRTGKEVMVEHLFADFKQWLHESGENAGEVIRSIRHYADVMLSMRDLPDTDATAQLIDRMEATQTSTPWPLLLLLYGNDLVPVAERHRASRAIDSFLMRRTVCRLTAKDYNHLFLQVLSVAQASDPECAGRAVEESLLGQSADSRRWPADKEFVEALMHPFLFDSLVRARLKSLLVGIENFLRIHNDKTELATLLKSGESRLNIEHLMPQSWERNWPLSVSPEDVRYEVVLEQRRNAIHQLGNLTLLTAKLNPSLSNRAWSGKRKEIQKHSLLLLTTTSVLTAPDSSEGLDYEAWSSEWNEERIKIRGRWMAEQALLAWPRPTGTNSFTAT